MSSINNRKQRLELLKKYYPVDEENKTVTFKIYYNQASELLDYSVGEIGKEMIKGEFLEKISDLFDHLPVDYKGNIVVEIDDYDVYDENTIMNKFIDFLEINSYDARHTTKKNGFISTLLIIIGCTILTINAILSTLQIYDSSTILSNVLKEALDITSWVFIWQAVTMLFLNPYEDNQHLRNIFNKLNTFAVSTHGEVKIKKEIDELVTNCAIDSSFSRVQKQGLALSSSLLFFEGAVIIIECIINLALKKETFVSNLIYAKIFFAIFILVGANISLTRFTNRNVKNVLFFSVYSLAIISSIIYFVYDFSANYDLSALINTIFTIILLFVNLAFCIFWNNRNKLKMFNKKKN